MTLVQMTSGDQMAINFAAVQATFEEAARIRSQLVVYPENTLFFRIQAGSGLEGPQFDDPQILDLIRLVDRTGTSLMLTTSLKGDSVKFNNSTILFRPGEKPKVEYSKIHLFDVDVPGAPSVRESDYFAAGKEVSVVEIDGWKFGLSICYDLRFAELYARYAQSVDVILVPSAFLVPTGTAHWEVLLRARAIEAQCYVAAPAQAGAHISGDAKRMTYGHSMVVDPWGKVLSELNEGTGLLTVDLDPEIITRVRQQIPMSSHRCLKPV